MSSGKIASRLGVLARGVGGAAGSRTETSRAWLFLGVALVSFASAARPAVAGDGAACQDQAAVAELAAGIPNGLLLAIGIRESGRYDASAGAVIPWPWAVNVEGVGHLFESREEAIAFVAAARLAGKVSIDVGCFQINLKYHPTAFTSLEQAFDPVANAAYAARFLQELFARERNWEIAAADYHSADPIIGGPYAAKVLEAWRGTSRQGVGSVASQTVGYRVVMGIKVWSGGYSPSGASAMTRANTQSNPKVRRGLPMVFTPMATVRQSYVIYR